MLPALPDILPLFPLPRVVLFPHAFIQLHIFEPRYRQMTAEILGSHQHFLLALTREHEGGDLVPPESPTFETACLTRIVRAEALPDGRFNILAQGRGAARLQGEWPGEPYRQANWRRVPFDASAPWPEESRDRLLQSLSAFAVRFEIEAEVKQILDLELTPAVLLNTFAMTLDLDPVEKQFLLESGSVPELAERLHQLLVFALSDRGFSRSGS